METSFFFTLGISFLLILLLVYHFKQRLVLTEQKQDTMFEIINNLVQEVTQVKRTIAMMHRPSTPYPTNERRQELPVTPLNSHDEEDSEDEDVSVEEEDLYSSDDSDDESIASDERIVVSDENEDDLHDDSLVVPINRENNEEVLSSQVLSSQDLSSQDLSSQDLSSQVLSSQDLSSQVLSSQVLSSQDLSSQDTEMKTEVKPNFSKMTLATLKEYITTKGWVEDATKLKKAQILSIIQERES